MKNIKLQVQFNAWMSTEDIILECKGNGDSKSIFKTMWRMNKIAIIFGIYWQWPSKWDIAEKDFFTISLRKIKVPDVKSIYSASIGGVMKWTLTGENANVMGPFFQERPVWGMICIQQ